MSTSVTGGAPGFYYTIGGSTSNRNVGLNEYTFSNIPSGHPMRLIAHPGSSCTPSYISSTYTTYGAHWGTVVYDFTGCSVGDVIEFQCGYHGRMNSGLPYLTVTNGC